MHSCHTCMWLYILLMCSPPQDQWSALPCQVQQDVSAKAGTALSMLRLTLRHEAGCTLQREDPPHASWPHTLCCAGVLELTVGAGALEVSELVPAWAENCGRHGWHWAFCRSGSAERLHGDPQLTTMQISHHKPTANNFLLAVPCNGQSLCAACRLD